MTSAVPLPQNKVVTEFLENNMVKVRIKTEYGVTAKTISFDDYCNAILGAREHIKIQEGPKPVTVVAESFLPVFNDITCIEYKLMSNDIQYYTLVRPAGPFTINYMETTFKDVGIPKMLVVVKLFKNIIQGVSIVCCKAPVVTKDTPLFCYPYSHVSPTSGSVCFGLNRITEYNIKEPQMLHSVPNMFLSMGNTDHSYGNNLSGLYHRPLLEKLSGKPFPDKWLKPMGKTYGQWMADRG